jgi:hypothetical protein
MKAYDLRSKVSDTFWNRAAPDASARERRGKALRQLLLWCTLLYAIGASPHVGIGEGLWGSVQVLWHVVCLLWGLLPWWAWMGLLLLVGFVKAVHIGEALQSLLASQQGSQGPGDERLR